MTTEIKAIPENPMVGKVHLRSAAHPDSYANSPHVEKAILEGHFSSCGIITDRITDNVGEVTCVGCLATISTLVLTSDYEKLVQRANDAEAAATELLKYIEHVPASTGVCCCGESVENHKVYDHKPKDAWEHNKKLLLDKYAKYAKL